VTAAISIRPARKADASDIALLVNIAAHGGPADGWAHEQDAAGTYNPIEIGRLQILREEGAFTWRNATMAENDGEIVGMLLGYREPDIAGSVSHQAPPYLRPLYELEGEAAGTWFISMLGVYAPWRNKGVGSALLEVAQRKAQETAASGVALITEDINAGARRLYERRGYAVSAKRPMVPFPNGGPKGEDWLLMVRDLS
jgi:ribosomal protein S18 acetylase RimI-like enzyme